MSGRPLDVLEASLEETVTVLLKEGTIYHGVLAGYDQHMNLVLDPPNGEESYPEMEAGPGDEIQDTTIIRGDNVVTIKT